jgi:hypothetical protein
VGNNTAAIDCLQHAARTCGNHFLYAQWRASIEQPVENATDDFFNKPHEAARPSGL